VGGDRAHLDESFITIAEYLGEARYRAMGLVGINYLMPGFGMAQGFNTRFPIDPGEPHDRAKQELGTAAQMRRRLDSFLPPERPFVEQEGSRPVDLDPAARQKLRSLGY